MTRSSPTTSQHSCTTASRRKIAIPNQHLGVTQMLQASNPWTSATMCKTQSITYICGHTVNFQLSICAASFQIQTRRGEVKAKCCASPDTTLHSLHSCGPCEREKVQRQVDLELAAVEAKLPCSSWVISAEVEAARSQAEQELWAQYRLLPDSNFKVKKLPKPGRGWATIAHPKASLLQTEVKPDNIPDQAEDEWGGALSLSDEIVRIEVERAADGIPPLAPMVSVFEEDNAWGDVTELGIYERVAQTSPEKKTTQITSEAKAVQEGSEGDIVKSVFVPPHRRHYQRLREMAQQAVHDTAHTNSKRMASETANLSRCCSTPLM